MSKFFIAILSFVVFTVVGTWVVSAQTETSTPTDTPMPTPTNQVTPTPQGAPRTGFGTVR